ncbi:Uncharacterized protein SCF082_LOCUS20072 [Durusdinium trenchii]|uniref:Uncharacterized protein n=1 Tax=Durusdinium trenchii TaxID=1381693 RepID=A0ABP0KZX4_9DINO
MRQERLEEAAKAQVRRLCTLKKRRVALNVPNWLIEEYQKRPKIETARMLMAANFDKEQFINTLEIIVKKQLSQSITIESRWVSEKEMRDDLKWARIAGAKKACEAKRATHIRKNQYDGVEEFYVDVRETGERKEEEIQVSDKPALNHDAFSGLERLKDRVAADGKAPSAEASAANQPIEKKLQKFMDSIVQKSGKCRALVRDIRTEYSNSPLMVRQAQDLENRVKDLDSQHEKCSNVMAKGEIQGFPPEFVKSATTAMNDATYVLGNCKKYEKKDNCDHEPSRKDKKSKKSKNKDKDENADEGAGKALKTFAGDIGEGVDLGARTFVWEVTLWIHPGKASSCVSAVRAAKGVVADIGEETALRSKGLLELSKCSVQNSERDTEVVFRQFELQIPIPLSPLPKEPGIRFTGNFRALRLRDWCKWLVDLNLWHVVCGLREANARRECAILTEFWQRFRTLQPCHQIWECFAKNNVDPGHCCPMIVHGDEGRGRKKAPFLVIAYSSMIGFGTLAANAARTHRSYTQMRLNYSESSHVHRFLTAVLPKMHKDEVALQTIFRFIVEDSRCLLEEGVQSIHGGQFHMAVLAVTGDWAFLAKAGALSRSFSNVEKRPRALHSQPKGVCHLCHAGKRDIPFEDFRQTAAWKQTMFCDDQPWNTPPVLLGLPHQPSRPAALFTFDLWHSLHLGLGKTFVASVFALISDRMTSTSIDARFEELSDSFMQFCDEFRFVPYVTTITKETVGWPARNTYPNGYWSKGHVTTRFLKFISHWLGTHDVSDCEMLTLAKEAVDCLDRSLEQLYRSDVWLEQNISRSIGHHGLRFVEIYGQLARIAYGRSMALWALMPKAHVCHHIWDECNSAGRRLINPLVFAVQISEDYIGKKSRLARKVHASQAIERVLQRTLAVAHMHWTKSGFLKG